MIKLIYINIVLLVFLLIWLPIEARAQLGPMPTSTPTERVAPVATLTPFDPTPTNTFVPTPTNTRRPTPTPGIVPSKRYVYLPLIYR